MKLPCGRSNERRKLKMARPRKTEANKIVQPMNNDAVIPEDEFLPKKSLFRIDEVANYFDVTPRCIWLWIEHGHLEKAKLPGIARVPRESILRCKLGLSVKNNV